MKLLADENFPKKSYHILEELGYDIIHIGNTNPSIDDESVMQFAIESDRLILTFDSDYSTLVFQYGYKPIGVVYFKTRFSSPDFPAQIVHKYLQANDLDFVGFVTVIEKEDSIRQRAII
jgi:predicted nuclease of predicted toxin-antitoxin system